MADNIEITEGSGVSVATDDVSGVQYQRIKVDLGADGAASPLVRGQQTTANSIPVALASDASLAVTAASLPLPTGASTLAEQQSQTTHLATIAGDTTDIETAVELIDDTVKTDDAAFTPATDKVIMQGYVADETGTDTIDEGDAGAARIDTSRRQLVRLVGATDANRADVDASGHLQVDIAAASTSVTISDGGGSVTVDNNGTFVVQENGAVLTALQLIDDTVATDGAATPTKGILIAGQDGTNAQTIKTDTDGNLQVDILTIAAGTNNIGKVRLTDGTLDSSLVDETGSSAVDALAIGGATPNDSVDSGNPVKIGMKAYELDGTAPQTAVAEADRVNAISDLVGRQFVATEHPRFFDVSVDYASAQTNASIKAAPGAGVAIYITDIFLSNGATAGNVTLLDGSGGTVKWECYPAINGGASVNFKNPIKLTDNTALCITSTTVTTHSLTITGFID